jgi:uncharacterized protein YutE (UPF0331/DUF86 family)
MTTVREKIVMMYYESVTDMCGNLIDQINSIKFFIIYVLSQQLQGHLQTQHSVDISNYIMEQYNIKSKTNYRQALDKIRINTET